MNNFFAFDVESTTTWAPLSASRLVGRVLVRNTSADTAARLSADGGTTWATLPPDREVVIEGVDLAAVHHRAVTGTVTIAVTGNTR